VQTIDYAELVRIGDELDAEKPYVELIDGLEVPKMSPKSRHSLLQFQFGKILDAWAAGRGSVGTEWRFWLVATGERRTSLVPDVAYLSAERFSSLEGEAKEMPPMAPDIAVEIRSPGDRPRNINRKIELYLAHGSLIVLDVDPKKREIIVHDTRLARTLREGDHFEHPAAPGLTFDVHGVFAKIT
jgi:Uma2 family endonuclease